MVAICERRDHDLIKAGWGHEGGADGGASSGLTNVEVRQPGPVTRKMATGGEFRNRRPPKRVWYDSPVRVQVLFFGVLKDVLGRASESLELADGVRLADVFDYYASAHPRLRDMRDSIVLARNQEFAASDTALVEGDEVALLPPVSGGRDGLGNEISDEAGHLFALTRSPIVTRALFDRVLRGDDGAVVDFEGVVRNNTKGRRTLYLDYECYEPMALKLMASIGREIAAQYPIGRIAMVHRLGRLLIGESSVVVVVTAPHRKPAFEAALEGINRLKRMVPIWKKEHFADGEVWVDGEWDESLVRA
jgi:molybdopterin synthase catalytic subunit